MGTTRRHVHSDRDIVTTHMTAKGFLPPCRHVDCIPVQYSKEQFCHTRGHEAANTGHLLPGFTTPTHPEVGAI